MFRLGARETFEIIKKKSARSLSSHISNHADLLKDRDDVVVRSLLDLARMGGLIPNLAHISRAMLMQAARSTCL